MKRYPDPANLLPISVDARIFVHSIVNSALTWSGRSQAGESGETQEREPGSKRGSERG
jgi:hypothetical protein